MGMLIELVLSLFVRLVGRLVIWTGLIGCGAVRNDHRSLSDRSNLIVIVNVNVNVNITITITIKSIPHRPSRSPRSNLLHATYHRHPITHMAGVKNLTVGSR
jgi:hypothetical protein